MLKKTVHDKLVAKRDVLIRKIFLKKLIIRQTKQNLKNKIPNVADFVKKAKLTELENKIIDISNLATKTTLTTVENKMPDVNNLVTKTVILKLQKFTQKLFIRNL